MTTTSQLARLFAACKVLKIPALLNEWDIEDNYRQDVLNELIRISPEVSKQESTHDKIKVIFN